METLLVTCKMCGKQFTYVKKSTTGMIAKYCSDECRAKAQKDARKKYIENSKDKKAAKSKLKKMIINEFSQTPATLIKENNIADDTEKNTTNMNIENMIVYERNVMPKADEMTMRVLDFAMRLGQLKLEGHEILNELSKETSEHDKQDEKFVHLLEAMDRVTLGQMKAIWKEEADSRTNRRDVKVLYQIIRTMICNIPQNPHQYARKTLENKQKTNSAFAEKYANTSEKIEESK